MKSNLDVNAGDNSPLGLGSCVSYAIPFLFIAWINAPINILQGVFAKYYGVSLAVLGSILLAVRLFDSVTDILMGYYSDRFYRRTGSRKLLFVVGGILLVVAGYLLYVPLGVGTQINADSASRSGVLISTSYLVFCYLLYYIALTMTEISHQAWASDIAVTSEEKSRIFSIRSMTLYVGLVFFYLLPQLPIFESTDITPEVLKFSIILAGLLLLPALYICVKKTPDGVITAANDYKNTGLISIKCKRFLSWRKSFKDLLSNTPLCLFFAFYLLLGIGAGLWYGVVFLYVDSYLDMGESFASMFMLAFTLSALVTPLWYRLSIRFGKKSVLLTAIIFYLASYLYTANLTPGYTNYSELVFLKILNTLGNGCFAAIAPAMLSEVVDYSNWRTRSQKTAVYFSLYLFFSKMGVAVGAGLSLAILGWYGYDATATTQTREATEGLMLAMVWLPIGLVALSLLPVIRSPIDTRRHQIVRRRLARLASRISRPSQENTGASLPFSMDVIKPTEKLQNT